MRIQARDRFDAHLQPSGQLSGQLLSENLAADADLAPRESVEV